jgi:cytochrome c-type biogenesis protein CcmH/NrfG
MMPQSFLSPARALLPCAALGAVLLGGCAGSAGSHARPEPLADPEAEVTAMQARLAEAPDDLDAWFRLGVAWQARADATPAGQVNAYRDSARVAFDSLLERDPQNVRAIVHRGLVMEDLNKPAEALAAYEKATALAPNDPLPYINLGSLLYFQFRKTFEAKNALVRAIELDPDNPDAHFNLGVLFADANLFGEAATEWRRVIDIDADGPAGTLAAENLERIRSVLEATEDTEGDGTASP